MFTKKYSFVHHPFAGDGYYDGESISTVLKQELNPLFSTLCIFLHTRLFFV